MAGEIMTGAQMLAHVLQLGQSQTEKAIKNCPEDRRLFSLAENKATPLWTIGHLANTTEFIGNLLGLGSPSGAIQPQWRKLFTPQEFGGSPITNNAADYPSWDETVAAYKKAMQHMIDGIEKLSDEDLLGSPKGTVPPPLLSMLTNQRDCFTLNVIHDGHHRGQIGMLAHCPNR